MFKCLDEVAEAEEAEVKEALESNEWDTNKAVKKLKMVQLNKCPKEEWKLGLLNNLKVCEVVLTSVLWDLDMAKNRVRKIRQGCRKSEEASMKEDVNEELKGDGEKRYPVEDSSEKDPVDQIKVHC